MNPDDSDLKVIVEKGKKQPDGLGVAAKPVKPPKPLPAPNSDFYEVYETLSPGELATVKKVREFMESQSRTRYHEILGG